MVLLLPEVDWNSLVHDKDMLSIMLVTGFVGIIGLRTRDKISDAT